MCGPTRVWDVLCVGLPQRTFQLWVGDGVRWFESGYDALRTQFLNRLRSVLDAVPAAPDSRTCNLCGYEHPCVGSDRWRCT